MTQAQPLMARLERTAVWRLKLRLQFTGWLQYLPPAMVGVVLAAVGGLGALLGAPAGVAVAITALGGLGVLVTGFDLLTAKLGLHRASRSQRRDGIDPFDLMRSAAPPARFSRGTSPMSTAPSSSTSAHTAGRAPSASDPPPGVRRGAPDGVAGHRGAGVPRRHRAAQVRSPAVIDVGRACRRSSFTPRAWGWRPVGSAPGADQQSVIAHLGERFDPERGPRHLRLRRRLRSRFPPLLIRLMQRRSTGGCRCRLFFADPRFTAPLDTDAAPFAAYGRCYEVCEWSPSSYNSQTTRCAALDRSTAGAPMRFDFCAATTRASTRRWPWASGAPTGRSAVRPWARPATSQSCRPKNAASTIPPGCRATT